jgi:quinol monooxygenase YgiN
MIIRIFHVMIRKNRVPDFRKMVREQSIPWLKRSEGMLGYFPGEPMDEESREFVMVTLWRDVAALRAFAGENWQKPVVTEDEAPLVEAMSAEHYLGFDRE